MKALKISEKICNNILKDILKCQKRQIEINDSADKLFVYLREDIKDINNKINKLPDFAEWYIENSAGGYQE